MNNYLLLWIPTIVSGLILTFHINKFITAYRQHNNLLIENDMYKSNLLYVMVHPSKQVDFHRELFLKQKNETVEDVRKKATEWFYLSASLFVFECIFSYIFY
jgi:hypothetical protein